MRHCKAATIASLAASYPAGTSSLASPSVTTRRLSLVPQFTNGNAAVVPLTKVSSTRLFSVSAYSGIPSDGKAGTDKLPLPYTARLPNVGSDDTSTKSWRLVEVDTFNTPDEIEVGRRLMNDVIIEGKAWPFEPLFDTEESYRGYFLSHAAFVVRDVQSKDVLGCFYIKPNFPGRCSHICNGGFIVDPASRGSRVGTLMGACFLRFACTLGYKAAYFNLVFASNIVSVRLWERLGFQRVAEIPKAARLVGMPLDELTGQPQLDTAYGYHYDLERLPADYDPAKEIGLQLIDSK
jgi:RimJ/RimL family protein N-acetyltransferase